MSTSNTINVQPCQVPESAGDVFQVVDLDAEKNALTTCMANATRFIALLWLEPVEREFYSWRYDSNTTVTYHDSERQQMAEDAVTWSHTGETVYYGVSLDSRELRTNQRATNDTVAVVPAIFADIEIRGHRDSKGELAKNQESYPDRKTALDRIRNLPLTPSVILDSGGGFHLYWLLDKPYRIRFEDVDGKRRQVPESVNRIAAVQEKWVELLALYFSDFSVGVDKAVKDLPRPLRLPGTRNHKYGSVVRFLDNVIPESPCRYSVRDFEHEISVILAVEETAKKFRKFEWSTEQEIEAARDAFKHLQLTAERDHYIEWTKIGASAYSISPSLEPEFHQWSCKSPKYNEAEVHEQWLNFAKYSKISFGTLWYHAEQDGWVPPHQKKKEHISVKCNDDLELISSDTPKKTKSGKITVPTIIRVKGEDVDLIDIKPAESSRKKNEKQIAEITGLPLEEVRKSVGEFLIAANEAINKAEAERNKKKSDKSGRESRLKILVEPDEYIVNDKAVKALGNDPDTFCRGGKLVSISHDTRSAHGIKRPENTPTITNLPTPIVRERLTRCAVFVEEKEGEYGTFEKQINPPKWCVEAVASRGVWPTIRPLLGITEYPVIRPDGTVFNTPGYDEATQLMFSPNGDVPQVLESPTRDDALRAVETLFDVVCDFPFAKEYHKTSWLASLLSLMARYAYAGSTPLFLVDANVPGSGKSMLLELVSLILTGDDAPRMPNPKHDEEARKKITSIAMAGDRLILIDNIVGSFGCESLDAAMTGTVWRDRKLSVNEMVVLPLFTVWCACGNNVMLAGDMPRRVAHIRLESDLEKPEERKGFKYPRVREHVKKNRRELLAAGLTILRAWYVAGKPDMNLSAWGSYDEWSGIVRNAIVWLGLADPRDACNQMASEADTEIACLRLLLHSWCNIDPSGDGLKVSKLLKRLKEAGSEEEEQLEDLKEAVCGLSPPRGDNPLPSVRALGKKFAYFRGRVLDGFVLRSKPDRTNTQVWYVEEVREIGEQTDKQTPEMQGMKGMQGVIYLSSHGKSFFSPIGESKKSKTHIDEAISIPSNHSSHAPQQIQHRDSHCSSNRWWQLYDGNLYCLDCQPPKEPSLVVAQCDDTSSPNS